MFKKAKNQKGQNSSRKKEKGKMVEANRGKMYWDWKQRMRMICMARRPDLTLKDTEKKIIYLIDATYPIEINKFMKEDGKVVVVQSDNYPSNCQLSGRRDKAINE